MIYKCESDWYKLNIKTFTNEMIVFNIDKKYIDNKVWLPNIYINTSLKTDEFKYISIQTTSYGDLNIEEVEKVIRELEIAKAEAICLTEFIRNKEWLKKYSVGN